MDTALELIDKLKSYFHADKMNAELEDGIKSFIRRNKLNDIELESLYDLIRDNCGKLPQVQYIAKLWKEQGQRTEKRISKYANKALADNKNTGWQTIISEMKRIRVKQDSEELTNAEIDLVHEYSDLSAVHNFLQLIPSITMPEADKATYMRKVKEDIDSGISVNMVSVRKAVQRRIDQFNQQYGLDEEEIIDGRDLLSRSFEQMQKAFGERKQALDPEPDKQMNFVI